MIPINLSCTGHGWRLEIGELDNLEEIDLTTEKGWTEGLAEATERIAESAARVQGKASAQVAQEVVTQALNSLSNQMDNLIEEAERG